MRATLITAALSTFVFIGVTQAQAETIPERLMGDLQEHFGFTDFQAAGIVGNLAKETGNFRYLQELNPIVKGSRGGIGYAQWTGDRRDKFEDWLKEQGAHLDPTSYEANYGFLYEELEGPYAKVVDRVLKTENIEDATKVFMKRFLAPHKKYAKFGDRLNYAESYMEGDFSGAGCQEYHDVEIDGRMIVVSMCPEPSQFSIDGIAKAYDDFAEKYPAHADRIESIGAAISEAGFIAFEIVKAEAEFQAQAADPFSNAFSGYEFVDPFAHMNDEEYELAEHVTNDMYPR